MINTIIFYLVLTIPGVNHPITYDKQATTLDECLEDVRDALSTPNPNWPNGVALQSGCIVTFPDKEEG